MDRALGVLAALMIHRDLTSTVGRTPLVELGALSKGLPGRVVAKLEMRSPLTRPSEAG